MTDLATPAWPVVSPTLEGARTLVRWAASTPLRAPWSLARLADGYCTRSPAMVLAEGEVAFTAPCCDLSSITAVALEAAGLRPTLILTAIRRALSHVKFQCGLELELEGRTWVVGFGVSSVYFYEGRFVETARRPLVLRATPGRVEADRPFLTHFAPGGIAGLTGLIAGYDRAVDVRWHARRQGALRYAWARWRAASDARARRLGRLEGVASRWR